MIGDYPLPASAAYIWAAGDKIWLGLPPTEGHTRGHSVHFPATIGGLQAMLRVLRERERAGNRPIGHAAAPIQYDLEQMERKMLEHTKSAAQRRKEAAAAEALLASVGL